MRSGLNPELIESCRLAALKEILHSCPDVAEEIDKAESLGDIWDVLFNFRLNIYEDIVAAGFSPTASELNQKTISGSAWNRLTCSYLGLKLFKKLLEENKLPTQDALARVSDQDGLNVWDQLLAGSINADARDIFNELLNKRKIFPKGKDLSRSWSLLIENHIDTFRQFIANDILLEAEDLARCDERGINGWHLLLSNEAYVPIAMELFRKGIFPKAEYLSHVNSLDGLHTWRHLTKSDAQIQAFEWLVNHGICPSQADMSVLDPEDGSNGWYGLLSTDSSYQTRYAICQSLLKIGVIPSSKDMAQCSKKNNENTWFLLILVYSGTIAPGAPLFIDLLNKGILPSAEDLALISVRYKTHAWRCLSACKTIAEREQTLQLLLQFGIKPSAWMMMDYAGRNSNAWHVLLNACKEKMFHLFLDNGTIPSTEDLAGRDKSTGKSSWDIMIEANYFQLMHRLFEMGIVPINQDELSLERHISSGNIADRYADKILRQIKAINKIKANVNMLPEESNEMINLLSREDHLNYDGFIYLYYLASGGCNSLVSSTETLRVLPLEIWYKIGCYLLPPFIVQLPDVHDFNFFKNDNQETFSKQWLSHSLQTYAAKIYVNDQYKGIAQNLISCTKSAETLGQMCTFFQGYHQILKPKISQTYHKKTKFITTPRITQGETTEGSELRNIVKAGVLLSLPRR